MAVEIVSGGRPPVQITTLSTDPANYVFVDGIGGIVNINSLSITVINYGNHAGALMVWILCDIHNWIGTGPPFRLNSTTFPANPLLDTIQGIGTVFGTGHFTQTPGNAFGPTLLSPPGVFFEVINGVQPNNNFSEWSGQYIFTYG